MASILKNIEVLYETMKRLEQGLEGKRLLRLCNGRMSWPMRGVYLMFEPGEVRENSPTELRIVRVGTHAVSKDSKSNLWTRLRTHKGTVAGGGNHRSSILRLHVGAALLRSGRLRLQCNTWGQGQVRPPNVDTREKDVEQAVSSYLQEMSVLWLDIPDEPSATSDRAYIERNIIALLASHNKLKRVQGSDWLGNFSEKKQIRSSGLWNIDHAERNFDEHSLSILEHYVDVTLRAVPAPKGSIAPKEWTRHMSHPELPFEESPSSYS